MHLCLAEPEVYGAVKKLFASPILCFTMTLAPQRYR
jgi:hypothetical protein